eukprot:TRINITY_DN1854_c0_g1_i1.p1 TRINITY_DN1854_c0_g1~~TRINITY_DN1854_c0_g1_i1.p1  ORF type:complete len:202 (+),score=10.77 TRINITY_DN1854_c0_g1_i1:158-763(+)
MERYLHHILSIGKFNWERLQFLDESHFTPKQLRRHTKVYSFASQQKCLPVKLLHRKAFSLTLLTCLTDKVPFTIDIREDSNNQVDFLKFIKYCVSSGGLKTGNVLILDNASIHGGLETYDSLMKVLESKNITLLYLPAYSPELNPCELIFQTVKAKIRANWDGESSIIDVLLKELSKIRTEEVVCYYYKCLDLKKIAQNNC